MADEQGFMVDGEFYPVTGKVRLCDAVLIEQVTGLDFAQFTERQDRMAEAAESAEATGEELEMDPVVGAGMVAIAVWQKHPRWKRDKVVDFCQQLDVERLQPVIPLDAGGDGPPAEAAVDINASAASSTSTAATSETAEGLG